MVPHNIMIAFFSIELDGEPPDISNSIRAPLFSTCCADTTQHWRFLSNSLKEFGPGQVGNIMSDFEFTPSTGCFGMDDST